MVMVEDESLPGGRAGTAAHCADRVTSGGEGAIAVAGAGSSSHVECSMSEFGRAGPGVVEAVGGTSGICRWRDLNVFRRLYG